MDEVQEITKAREQGETIALEELTTLMESARIVMDAIGSYLDATRLTAGIDLDTGELGGSEFPGMVHAAMVNHARATGRFQLFAAAVQAAKTFSRS